MPRDTDPEFTPEQQTRFERILLAGERPPNSVAILVHGRIEVVPLDDIAPEDGPPVPHGRLVPADPRYGRRRVRGRSLG